MPQNQKPKDNSFLDDLAEIGKAALPYVAIAALVVTGAGIVATAGGAAEAGAAAGAAEGGGFFNLARMQIAKLGAEWAASDLPQTISPYIKRIASEYGQPAAKAVLNDLKDIPLGNLTANDIKGAAIKRFGAASENAIFKESQTGIQAYIRSVRANPTAQRGYINFLLNKEERAQMIENANRRVAFTLMRNETLGSGSAKDTMIRGAKRINRTIFDYGISPKTIPQRFVNSYIKGFVRGHNVHATSHILTTIPGRKAFLIRKYVGAYRRYNSQRLLFGKPGKTSSEIGKQFLKYISANQAWTPEILGQASGYASGSIFFVDMRKRWKNRETNNHSKGNKKSSNTVQVHSYTRNGKQVHAYTRTVGAR